MGETLICILKYLRLLTLSVSSNGSTWVKHDGAEQSAPSGYSFSILERIDVGETIHVQVG